MRKLIPKILIGLILIFTVIILVRYFWVFGSGTKAGTLNTFMKKGYVFKTYEGKIIQSGFKQNIQSNEFNFSVENEEVAQVLLHNAGREVEVHYKEYIGALPWRGLEKYVVDSVYQVRDGDGNKGIYPR